MSRKYGTSVSYLVIFGFIFYLAYNFSLTNERVLLLFIDTYLNHFQTYFFVMTLLVMPFILFEYAPILSVEYRVRLGKKLFHEWFSMTLFNSLKISIFIFLSFLLSALLFRFSFMLSLFYMHAFVRLSSFVLFTQLLFYVGYIFLKHIAFGFLILIFSNFLYVATVMSANFIMQINFDLDLISNWFVVSMSILMCTLLFVKLKEKDDFL